MQNQNIAATNAIAQKVLDRADEKNMSDKLSTGYCRKDPGKYALGLKVNGPEDIFAWGLCLGDIVSTGDYLSYGGQSGMILLPETTARAHNPDIGPAPRFDTQPDMS